MKQISLVLIAITIFLGACNNNKKKETITSEEGKEKVTIESNPMQNAMQDMERQRSELEKLQPLSMDQLKALLPATLMGAQRKSFSTSSSMGAGLARGEYELNDSTIIKLDIYDCGGAAGAGIYTMQYMSMFSPQPETDEEYTRVIDFKGGKAFEQCDKTINDCTISYFSGGRFMVTLGGEHVGADALKQAAGGLNIK